MSITLFYSSQLTGDLEEVAERVRVIAALDVADGLVFDPASVTATTIRDEGEYVGVRVKLGIARAHLASQRERGSGSALCPRPVRMLPQPSVNVGKTD